MHDAVGADMFFNGMAFLKFNNFTTSLHTSKLALTSNPSKDDIENHLRQQDIIFIGGGDTEFMLRTWKETGFEEILQKLKNEGCLPVIMGLSAGGSFPFQSAISLTDDEKEYKALSPGYDWIPGSFTPHATSKTEAACTFDNGLIYNRMSAFESAIRLGKMPPGYAIPEDCMLHFCDGNFVGAFSARPNVACSYVTPEGVKDIIPILLERDNSSCVAKETLAKLHQNPEEDMQTVYANQCRIL